MERKEKREREREGKGDQRLLEGCCTRWKAGKGEGREKRRKRERRARREEAGERPSRGRPRLPKGLYAHWRASKGDGREGKERGQEGRRGERDPLEAYWRLATKAKGQNRLIETKGGSPCFVFLFLGYWVKSATPLSILLNNPFFILPTNGLLTSLLDSKKIK